MKRNLPIHRRTFHDSITATHATDVTHGTATEAKHSIVNFVANILDQYQWVFDILNNWITKQIYLHVERGPITKDGFWNVEL